MRAHLPPARAYPEDERLAHLWWQVALAMREDR
jgi:hypothetical protein